jgi:hypothetical protein
MKKILSLLLITYFFCYAKCNKEDLGFSALPPATQEGRNTLGFMLNGKPWTPKGFNGRANLSIDVDFGFNSGGFSIAAYREIPPNTDESFGIGIKDSLNFMLIPVTLQLNKNSLYGVRFANTMCDYYWSDINTFSSGNLSITKLDRANRIISGTFNATLYRSGCDTIKITEGRFDMKY